MKKYSVLFFASFLTYAAAFLALPYMTARTWADCLAMLFILACVFELLYIIQLRKKDSVSLGRSIGRYFLGLSFAAELVTIIWYGDLFINGYTPRTLIGGYPTGDTVYGMQAVLSDGWSHILFVPLLLVSLLYQAGYYLISRRLKNKALCGQGNL